ncbi:branched-chain amino acid transport system II carrier protein, partial [Streptococcus gordonii]|uniref:branched-chain amino acid transport system II carrier protein n=1 Tax=Streptococcus gordonii TaxID=1302 RepID=UPI0038575840
SSSCLPVPAEVIAKGNAGVYVLSQATQAIFGPTAQIFLAAMVTVTCFTTTAGLIVSTGEFFNNTFPKVSYKTYATVTCIPIFDKGKNLFTITIITITIVTG